MTTLLNWMERARSGSVLSEEDFNLRRLIPTVIIALSCLMTTTMPAQKEVIMTLKEMGLRDRYRVIVGGGPPHQAWAVQIGADGYGATAVDAVRVAKELMHTISPSASEGTRFRAI